MNTIISKDGTKIAYDKQGAGPAVILIPGVLCTRAFWTGPEIGKMLAPRFTAYNYDRRGRGESGAVKTHTVEREIEDIEALIDEAGGSAYLFGHSSGAALALEAALNLGDKVSKLVMYEPPYNDDPKSQGIWKEYTKNVTEALASNRRDDAVALHMKQIGMSADQTEEMRHTEMWSAFVAMASTLACDPVALLGEDRSVPTERAASVIARTLVLNGSTSGRSAAETSRTLSQAIPHAQLRILEGEGHNVGADALAPVLVEFFSE